LTDEFDVIVIGGGPAGEHFAGKASAKGLSVVLVEEELVGGECSYWACMPSKTILRPVQLLAETQRVPGVAAAVSGPLDVQGTFARRDYMTSSWSDAGQVRWLESAGIELVRGHGRIVGPRQVEVEARGGERTRFTAHKAVVVAVGSSASFPPIAGLADAAPWTNREILETSTVPDRLVVIGGGVVGVEMSQAMRRLGSSEVTILEGGARLLGNSEPFAGEELAHALTADGITVRTGVKITSVSRPVGGGPVTVEFDGGTVTGDELLVAAGRRPRTGDLGLDSVGLESGSPITVDDAMLAQGVVGEWLYVIGDANGRALLTHMGKYQGRVVAEVITGGSLRDVADDRAVTGVIFTDPQVAMVGRTEAQARELGLDVRVLRTDIGGIAASSIWGEGLVGTCQLVVDQDREVIVGATFVGAPVGEMLHAATIAIVAEVTLSTLRHAVAAFPTLSEIWLELVESYFEQ
jgi:pyruvate/2-oxoglutarate dehydrogenase complex dihydrolipoamide dehydrogenase (E3) component